MKRHIIRLEDVADRDNLMLAFWKATRKKRHLPAVATFTKELDQHLESLRKNILNAQPACGQFERFVIHDPKRREIAAAPLIDRILHHAMMNLAAPQFEKNQVFHSYACRPGKGVHAAIAQAQMGLRSSPWFIHADIASYFSNIDHSLLKNVLASRFKGRGFLTLMNRIIDLGGLPNVQRGLPIGALTSQYFANDYLSAADRFLLSQTELVSYVRYMDDLLMFFPSQIAAQQVINRLHEFLFNELYLRLKPGAEPRPSSAGLLYCGYRVKQGVILPSARKMRRYRAACQRLQSENPSVSDAHRQRYHESAYATLLPSQTLHFRQQFWGAEV